MMDNATSLKIAIVGRPNVGKSSLFNRIVGARKAIVEPHSGTTRDRLHADIRWKGKSFTIIDTAGFEAAAPGDMAELVLKQIRIGIEEADIILFVTDGITGIAGQDRELSSILRKTSKKVYLVVNKIDSESDTIKTMEFYSLGLGEPYAVSAMHGRGIEKLCNDLAKGAQKSDAKDSAKSVKVAIVGRPNVGKSSYLNAILERERAIVHSVAGTTRDAIDTDFKYKERDYVLIDTAGIRHNAKIDEASDFYGSVRSKEAIKRSDAAIVLIDGSEGLTKDSVRIIDLCREEGKALVLAVNKWDLVKGAETSKYRDRLIMNMNAVKDIPVVFISCKTGRNVKASLDVIWSVCEKSKTGIGPDKLADILKSLNNATEISSKRIKFKFLIQEGVSPPGFILGVKNAKDVSENLKRFVENFFRKIYDFEGVPIRIRFEKEVFDFGGDIKGRP
ncbi:MAG: ribosome biogenesis GTPase Der [Candidatus Omnitrophica bacterium]|nr:ribosome biogenesis GTPase Der [Candidatus Omnitrophota bacterium]